MRSRVAVLLFCGSTFPGCGGTTQASPEARSPAPQHAEPVTPAPASSSKAPRITLAELADRRDLWPQKIRLTKKVGFSPTEIYQAGAEFDLVDIAGTNVQVDSGNGIIEVPSASTDLLERASALMASLTPEQLAVTAKTLPQHPELWPVELKITRALDFSGGNKVPAGRAVVLRKFEGEQLNLYDREIKNWFNAAINETDILARARERVKLAEKDREPFFGRAVGAALESAGKPGGDESFAKADYFLVYQARLGCGRCAAFIPELKTFYDRMKPAHPGFEAVFVSADSSAENMKQLVAKEKLPGRAVAYDRRLEAADLGTQTQGGELLPLVFLYDHAGKLVTRNHPAGGKPSASDVLATLEQKLGEKR